MAISNSIFEHFRKEKQKEEEAIKYLQSKGYIVSCKEKTYASNK
jgi:hypothetical protein|tara:strand:+ start:444 stop:575 length:132 start_codon:yes stop_codon:yes gene_type:complete